MAVHGDRARLAEIFLVARRHAFPWILPERFRLGDFKRETDGETILTAEVDGRVAGFASVWEPDGFLHHLYVDPPMHRRGIGRALVVAMAGLCEKPLKLKCQTNNRPAMAFYRHLGFVAEDSGVSDMGPWVRYRAPAGA
ncbi:MAG: GNAT family N-acetyltransferase [Alphaproteobacteria bacterium]|nr:GNAT family N-acetyltransferase [Alphaproteobacteria bacterium]